MRQSSLLAYAKAAVDGQGLTCDERRVGRHEESSGSRDVVGRYGGEEFLVVMPGCDGEGAVAACERIRAAVAAEPIVTPDQNVPVTVSIGVATWLGVRETSEVIDRADSALYRAKHGGRNRVELAPEAANDRMSFADLMVASR